MLKKIELNKLDDFFTKLSCRKNRGIYFYRIAGYNKSIEDFLAHYMQAARRSGVVLMGKIPNPDERQLSYYEEMIGLNFCLDPNFFSQCLAKWLPRVNEAKRKDLSIALFSALDKMRKEGKNENILKNAYIKYMCWFYYKFERMLNLLGEEDVPKILYQGNVSLYELKVFSILAEAGCDILLLEIAGDLSYQKLDLSSTESFLYQDKTLSAFPTDFSLEKLIQKKQDREKQSTLYCEDQVKICSTNTWLSGNVFADCLVLPNQRGQDRNLLYNMLVRVTGVEDKTSYLKNLFQWKVEVENQGRGFFALNEIVVPSVEELQQFNGNFSDFSALLTRMSSSIRCSGIRQVENQAKKALIDILNREYNADGANLNRTKNKAVYLLTYFQRYGKDIFKNYREDAFPVFVYYGVCTNKFEALFLEFLSYLPLDVILINPDLTRQCLFLDPRLFEKKFEQSMKAESFPQELNDITYSTVAYHAEEELTELMYQDTGLYRLRQYQKAVSVPIQTMYEEIYLLWDQELKYRPNFEVMDDRVVVPSLLCKISGVKDGNIHEYWASLQKLYTKDTLFINKVPYILSSEIKNRQICISFLKNRKLLRDKIKGSSVYPYSIFREETQDFMLDKLQELLDSGLVKGTYSNGMEFTIIAVILNLDNKITRMIQNFDFTRKNPKILVLATDEKILSLEDSIVLLYLHMVGFDVALFVPTGYRVVENYYTKPVFSEYQIGEYMYDLKAPPLRQSAEIKQPKLGFINRLFRKD